MIKDVNETAKIKINQIDTENIPQITNPFSIRLEIN